MTRQDAMKDYGGEGVDIRTAKLLQAKEFPDPRNRPGYILWNGEEVWTQYELKVPRVGRFYIEFLSGYVEPMQGVDVKIEPGCVRLAGGEEVQLLRTWHDPQYEDSVEYQYSSGFGVMRIWNVYMRPWFNGEVVEEKWTGNAGFLASCEGDGTWLFRCSDLSPGGPEFSKLVFRVKVRPE